MSVTTRPLTYEDLHRMPDDRNRYEIIDGALFVSPSPNRPHQRLAARLYLVVGGHVAAEGLGEVLFAPVDVRLTPHDIVQPDLLFLRRDRLGLYRPGGIVDGPPDLVVEIVSPSSRTVDLARKAALYARTGVPEYWTVDAAPPEFRVRVLRNGVYEEVVPSGHLLRSTVLPTLVLDLSALFADVG